MRILIAVAVFAITMGVLFIFNSSRIAISPSSSLSAQESPSDIKSSPSISLANKVIGSTQHTLTIPSTISELPPVATPPPSFDISILSSLTLTFKVKQSARLEIKTLPQAQCDIKVTLPSGTTSGANGLVTKSTDLTGYTSWSWNISWNTKTGNGKIDLSCTKDQLKASKNLVFMITQ